MTTVTAYNPPLFGYDFAKEFLKTGKGPSTKIYHPLDPDFGTMLTVNMKNNLFVHSGIQVGIFDYTSYFVHFLLGMLFMGQERNIRTELGIKNVLYLYEMQQLKIVVLSELNGQKTLLLKTVNFNEQFRELKHYWSEDDLRTICSIIYDMNEIPENYNIESHWLDLSVENTVGVYEEQVLSPSISFTSDIIAGGVLQDGVKREAMDMKRKFRKYFRWVRPKTSYQSIKSFFISMGSVDEREASGGLEQFFEAMTKIFKDNLYGSTPISRDFSSTTSISQTGFMHGALTGLQNKFSFHTTVEQVFTSNPGFRINIRWTPFRTWSRMIEGRPIQIYFLPGLENQGIKHNEVVSKDLIGQGERTFLESLKSEAFFVYINFNARGKTSIIRNVQNIAPALNLLKDTKELAAVTLKDKIVHKLESLKKLLDIEYSFILRGHMPCSKREKQNYLSRYLHGYFAANEVSRTSGSVFRLKHLNPSDLEKQYLTSFLLKTDTETTDLVINVYERQIMSAKGYAVLGDLKKKHVYPVTCDQVKHTVVVDYFVSFSTTNKPEYKNHVITREQVYMKSVNSEQSSDFAMLKITNIDLQQIVAKFDPSKSMRDNKPLLSTIKNYFEENFSYIRSKFELKAAMDGLLHKSKIQSNLINIKKNVLQVAFLENENLPEAKVCLFNLAFGDSESTIHDLDEMRYLLEEGPIKGYDKVKVINIALTKSGEADPAKPLVLENRFLSVLHLCSKPRIKRNALCSHEEMEPLIETVDQSKITPKVMKRRKYLTALGHVASGVMFGLMAKDFVSDIIHGDIIGIAINAGFLFSNYIFHGLAGKLFSKANLLEREGSIALSNICKVGSSFLRRSASFAFVGFDLYNSVQAYKMGQSGAMVNIVADSSYLALDMAETVIEISEAFGLIEGVSAVTGPIGWAAGAALLVGADIYRSIEKVNDIDHIVHLSRMERLAEGFRAFFGMDPEQHVARLMRQKTILQTAVEQISAFLDQHDTIDKFIFPANIEDSSDININLSNKEFLTIGRSVPSAPASTAYFCLPKLNSAGSPSRTLKAFYCKNALGLRKLSPADNSTTYILMASGNGTIMAAENGSHVYDIVGPGVKRIFGSRKGDTFILRNEKSCGSILAGQLENNILDFSKIGNNSQLIFADGIIILNKQPCIKYTGMGTVVGRKNVSDKVIAWRGLNHIELHGGNSKESDDIFIPGTYKSKGTMVIIISGGNTNVTNDAIIGNFTYIIMDLQGKFFLNIIKESTVNRVKLIYNSFTLTMLNVKVNARYTVVSLKFGENISGEVKLPSEHLSIQFQDGADLYVKQGRMILDVTITYPIDDAISIYSELAEKLNISIVIHSLMDSKTVTLNHQALNEKNYAIDIVYASSKYAHFQSMSPEVVYILGKNSQHNVTIVVNPKQKLIIDINSLPKNVSLAIRQADADIILGLSYPTGNSSIKQNHQLILENAMTNQSYKNIVIKKLSTMVFRHVGNGIDLIAPPLTFSKDDSLIVISPNDGIEYGMKIFFQTKFLQYEFYNMNKTDLMLTNVRISEIYEQQAFTLILKDFYRNEIMRSLKLTFENALIDFQVQDNVERATRAKEVKFLFKMLAEEIAQQSYII